MLCHCASPALTISQLLCFRWPLYVSTITDPERELAAHLAKVCRVWRFSESIRLNAAGNSTPKGHYLLSMTIEIEPADCTPTALVETSSISTELIRPDTDTPP